MMDHIFSNCGSISNRFAERFKKLEEENFFNLAVLLLCSASGWNKKDELIGQMIEEDTPALLPLYNRIVSGMGFEEVSQVFNANDTIGKALEQFLDIGFQDLNEDQKEQTVEQLITDVQKRVETIVFVSEMLRDDLSKKQKEDIFGKYYNLDDDEEDEVYVSDLSNPAPETEFLLMYNNVPFLPKADITAIKAQAKHGKTHLCAIFAAALIKDNNDSSSCCGVYRLRKEPYKVLFVDTEQSKHCSDKLHIKIKRMAGLSTDCNSSNLKVINLRRTKNKSRLKRIKKELESDNYDVLLLDGIKDLAKSVNDEAESNELVEDLTSLIADKNINLCTVLHQNPGNESEKMRGHLGTELCNKAFEVFQTRKKDGVFNVLTTERRETELDPFAFQFEDNGLVKECLPNIVKQAVTNNTKEVKEKITIDGRQFWANFFENETMTKSELARKYEAQKGCCSTSRAGEKAIDKALGKYLKSEKKGREAIISLIPIDEYENQN